MYRTDYFITGVFNAPVYLTIQQRYPLLKDYVYDVGTTIETVTQWFVGREFVFKWLDAQLRDHPCGYLRLIADAGLGKTAIAAEVARRNGALAHFVNASQGITRPDQCLNHLSASLIARYDLPHDHLPERAGLDSNFLQMLLQEAAAKRDDKPVLLVIDALDEADPVSPGRNWLHLPDHLPEGVYVLLTHRPGNYPVAADARTPQPEPLIIVWDEPRQQSDVAAHMRRQAEREEVRRALEGVTPPITVEQFVSALQAVSEGNFMYLAYVLADIERREPGFDPLDLQGLPRGLRGYYEHFWTQMEQVKGQEGWVEWDGLYRPVIELLGVAQEPVTVDWLVFHSGRKAGEIRERALLRWLRFLRREQRDSREIWRVIHRSFADFLSEKVDLPHAHAQIANHYLTAWGGLDKNLPDLQALERDTVFDYGLRYVPVHLVHGGQVALLYELVKSSKWAEAKPLNSPKALWYLEDLHLAFEEAISQEPPLFVDAMGYALKRALVQQQIASPKSEAVVFLAELGEFAWALKLTRIRSLRERISILKGISKTLAAKRPAEALLALKELAQAADHSGNLLDQCKCRCLAAQKLVQLGLSSEKAKPFANEAQALASYLPSTEFASYQVDWDIPTMIAIGRLDAALELLPDLSPLDQCQTLRIAANILPDDHPQKLVLAQRALDIAKTIGEQDQALEQQIYCLLALARSQTQDESRRSTINELVSALDSQVFNVRSLRIFSIDRIAKMDLERARTLVEEQRWPGTDGLWETIVSETAKFSPDEALDLLDKRMSNWAVYPLVLEDIIEQIALHDTERAKGVIRANEKKLERNLDGALLALARGYLVQDNRKQAERIFYQPAFFVSEEHNIHSQAEMQLAMFQNALNLISLDAAAEWYERFPVCTDCHNDRERQEARVVLVRAAALSGRFDLVKKYAYNEQGHEMVALALAESGKVAEARAYMDQHFLGTHSRLGAMAYALIAQYEAECDLAVLEKMMQHYEANPPHHFCDIMVYLPDILDNLACLGRPLSISIENMIERVWPILVHWKCPNDATPRFRALWDGQCGCHSKKDRALGQIAGTMARINRKRAQEMLSELPDSPAKAYALVYIVQADGMNDLSLAEVKATICAGFPDAYSRTKFYYDLAAALPNAMADDAKTLVEEADLWLEDSKFVSELKEQKARLLTSWLGKEPAQEQIDQILSIEKSLETFKYKQAIFFALFRQAQNWSEEAQVDLLRYVIRSAEASSLASVQAAIAAAIPLVHALGGDELLEKLFSSVNWAYQ